MKKILFVLILLLVTAGLAFFSCRQEKPPPEKTIAQLLLTEVDSFSTVCARLQIEAEAGDASMAGNDAAREKRLQAIFLRARRAYKTFEWAAEYFEPSASRAVNGPPVQEVEISGQVFEPAGLQVIEGYLFPRYDSSRKAALVGQLAKLQSGCGKYRSHFGNIDLFDWQVFDAVKLEVFRIITVGITGFDNPLTLRSMDESAVSLESLKKVMSYYTGEDPEHLSGKIDSAIGYLTANTNFNSFDRAAFITGYANPITIGISDLEERSRIHVIRYNRLLNQDAKTLFDSNAYNVNAYSPDPASFITDAKVSLGKLLFFDQGLSGNGKRSCGTCHQPEKAFADGLVKNTVLDKHDLLARNTPTLINAALQAAQFYDSRVRTLEDQSRNVVQNEVEMHGSMDLSVQRLWKDSVYRGLFARAFPKKDRDGIDTLEVMNALGSYVRSLTALNSRFDEYMRGNRAAMNVEAVNGFNLFMGKARCATCHYMPLFNGTFPPRFVRSESEVIGVPATLANERIDPDPGRYAIVKVESFQHAFKTPTVRNAARTAPYMHNGVFSTLDQVMDFYNKGGGTGVGLKIDNQTLPFDKLDLTEKEKAEVVEFMRSLDSK